MTIAECLPPLLSVIGGLLSKDPQDVVSLFYMTSRCLTRQSSFAMNTLWQEMYAARWVAFFEALRFQQRGENWLELYRDTLLGHCEFIVEVFDRQKKEGFAMSAMPARTHYDSDEDGYIAWYISASEVPPELIPSSDGHRLRFCPASVRDPLWQSESPPAVGELPCERLWDSFKGRSRGWGCMRRRTSSADSTNLGAYPYLVLEGTQGLKIGGAVELQWKMQEQSPFGWWYGQLEQLQHHVDGKLATATLVFPHFHTTSQWYRLAVRFGDNEVRDCALGGKSGGLRPVRDREKAQWMRHFPARPIQV